MMNFWIEDDDNYDDFEDNLQLVTTIYKFTSKEMDLMKLYLRKYRELKQLSWSIPLRVDNISLNYPHDITWYAAGSLYFYYNI